MIDHVLGRPSVPFRKVQVLAVVSFWSFYLYRYGPSIPRLSALIAHTHAEATATAPHSSAESPPSSPGSSPPGKPSS